MTTPSWPVLWRLLACLAMAPSAISFGPLGWDSWWSHDQNNMVVSTNILQYANIGQYAVWWSTHVQDIFNCMYIFIIYIYAFVHMYIYMCTCFLLVLISYLCVLLCIYVYLCVYFVHVLTTAYIERVQQRTTGGPSPGHHGTVQVYFEGRHLERLRPLSGLDGSPFGWWTRRLGWFF